jgi:DNA polymerase-3 subunit chi
MTARQVEFHTGVADPVAFACRLLRKASRLGARVAVQGSPEALSRLDIELWTFDERDFVPHVRLSAARGGVVSRTPVWLLDAPPPADPPTVLVNVDGDAPGDNSPWRRVIEIVGREEPAAGRGRERWRQYRTGGWAVIHHDGARRDAD